MKINVLGTEYTINEATENEDTKLTGKDGYCDSSTKTCVIDRMEDTDINSKGNNEELVDWFAIQWHKISVAFEQIGI